MRLIRSDTICGAWMLYNHDWSRTSDSLNEGLLIKMTREKFQRK